MSNLPVREVKKATADLKSFLQAKHDKGKDIPEKVDPDPENFGAQVPMDIEGILVPTQVSLDTTLVLESRKESDEESVKSFEPLMPDKPAK